MSKTVYNILIAALAGLITAALFLLQETPVADSVAYGLLSTVFFYALLLPSVFTRLKHYCCDIDWAEELAQSYQRIPAAYRQSFWLLFALINLAFLFHTVNFMWGGTDWSAVRTTIDPNESLADGRFSAFWLQQLLFNGKILPVINNLWAFLGLSLAGVFLAIYWNLPQKTSVIVLTGLLLSVNPYTLSWLYSAKNTLGSLWLPAISLGALLLADTKTQSQNRNFANYLTSVMMTLFVLGSYLPAVNFIAVAILGKVFLKTAYADISLKDAFLRVRQSLANLTAAIMVYLLIMSLLKDSGVLAAPFSLTAPITACWFNLPLLFKSAVGQFAGVLPFVDVSYQFLFIVSWRQLRGPKRRSISHFFSSIARASFIYRNSLRRPLYIYVRHAKERKRRSHLPFPRSLRGHFILSNYYCEGPFIYPCVIARSGSERSNLPLFSSLQGQPFLSRKSLRGHLYLSQLIARSIATKQSPTFLVIARAALPFPQVIARAPLFFVRHCEERSDVAISPLQEHSLCPPQPNCCMWRCHRGNLPPSSNLFPSPPPSSSIPPLIHPPTHISTPQHIPCYKIDSPLLHKAIVPPYIYEKQYRKRRIKYEHQTANCPFKTTNAPARNGRRRLLPLTPIPRRHPRPLRTKKNAPTPKNTTLSII